MLRISVGLTLVAFFLAGCATAGPGDYPRAGDYFVSPSKAKLAKPIRPTSVALPASVQPTQAKKQKRKYWPF